MPDSAPNPFGAYIASEVARAELDFQNVRSRSLSLITTSGGLLTLVAGLLAVGVGSSNAIVPTDSRWTVAVALVAFLASAVCGLLINFPQGVVSSDEKKLGAIVKDHWNDTTWDQDVATALVKYLVSLRADTRYTVKLLKASISLQISGVGFVGLTAILILIHAT
jgi:hypothetical protein